MSIEGKDYLTMKEAAHYCGVSFSQFRAKAKNLGLLPGRFMGKYLYRKADLQRIIEELGQWHQ